MVHIPDEVFKQSEIGIAYVDTKTGVDIGFAIDSNGERYFNPQYLRKYEDKLKKEKRKLSRKEPESSNYFKQRQQVLKIHKKIRNTREDFLHKMSSKITSENQAIIVEDLSTLSTENMQENHNLFSWSEFVRKLEYKADRYGRQLIKIDRSFPSNKLCSFCGNKNEDLTLSQQLWTCSMCSVEHDRDVNAAKNVLDEGKRILRSS